MGQPGKGKGTRPVRDRALHPAQRPVLFRIPEDLPVDAAAFGGRDLLEAERYLQGQSVRADGAVRAGGEAGGVLLCPGRDEQLPDDRRVVSAQRPVGELRSLCAAEHPALVGLFQTVLLRGRAGGCAHRPGGPGDLRPCPDGALELRQYAGGPDRPGGGEDDPGGEGYPLRRGQYRHDQL